MVEVDTFSEQRFEPMEITHQPIPLKIDTEGAVRVGGTRVPLDTVVAVFKRGATAEEIVQQFPSLALADVYAAISYYLRNSAEVEDYLQQRADQARRVREKNEARFDMQGIRERLLARQSSQS